MTRVNFKRVNVDRGGLGGKSGPGVTVRPAHAIHGARPSQYTARCPVSTRRVAQSVHGALPSQYTARCPLNASHVSTSRSPILKITHTLNIILDDYKEITSYMFCLITFGSTNLTGWTLAIVLAIVTLQGRYSFLDEYA